MTFRLVNVLRDGGITQTTGAKTALTARFSLDEKAALTAGADTWHTAAVPRLGVPGLRMSDGPSGARGIRFTGLTTTSLPCGTALAATWNRDLVHEVGNVLGEEARRKQAQVLLAPTVNVHRHPLAGRNFECFSEDPYLSAEMAHAYITGVQSRGIGCAIKHLVANDQEQDRMEISVDVDERALRELYLPAFEKAVRQTGVWAIMAAYNRLHGIHCSEHAGLLDELLRGEWGFDGLVMSDWFGTHSTLAVSAGLDLEMPGPPRYLGSHLVSAVRQQDVNERVVDRAATNVLKLVDRTANGVEGAEEAAPTISPEEVARQAAEEAIVLLTNNDLLPLDTDRHRTLAVIGPKADRPDIQGRGSAHVDPAYVVTPLEGIVSRAGPEVTILDEVGVPSYPPTPLTQRSLLLPSSEGADTAGGLLVEYLAGHSPSGDGGDPEVLHRETVPRTRLMWIGDLAPGLDPVTGCTVRARAQLAPERSGMWRLRMASTGTSGLWIDGKLVIDNRDPEPGDSFYGAGSTWVDGEIQLEAGRSYELVIELYVKSDRKDAVNGVSLTAQAPELPYALERAVTAATEADAAVVVVGESTANTEGLDRTSMDLPDEHMKLIRAVAAVNPATVVVVNSGAPVAMEWAHQVAAVVQLWYLGQETGSGLAAVLFGDTDPSGRLPTTFPQHLEDTPAYYHFPGSNGRVRYAEGLMVGYRHYDTRNVDPRFCFGHGLSYTEFLYRDLKVRPSGCLQAHTGSGLDGNPAVVEVEVEVTNVGDRWGREVVQLYVHDEDAPVARPEQELKGFRKLALDPGESRVVRIGLPWRAFAYWDPGSHGWKADTGRFEIRVGSSSRAIHQAAVIDL